MKKLFVTLLCIAVISVFLPTIAFAADINENVNGGVITGATTDDELSNYLGEGGATIKDNGDGTYTVTLLKDVSLAKSKDLKFGNYDEGAEQPTIIFDLNGKTIKGTSIVIANLGNLIIEDSSTAKTGKVVYDGGAYLGTVNNAGYKMTVNGGTFVCNGAGSSAYNSTISTAGGGTTIINGGAFEGNNASSVISYGETIVNGGSFGGKYGMTAKVSGDGDEGRIILPENSTAEVHSDTAAFYRIEGTGANADKAGSFDIKGGTFNTPEIVREKTDTIPSTIDITGGKFIADPSAYVPESSDTAIALIKDSDSTGVYVLGAGNIAEQAGNLNNGGKLEVMRGDIDISGLADGVIVENSGDGKVTLDGEEIKESVTVCNHVWGQPEWKWSEDHSSATATFTCTKDAEHKETATVMSDSEEIKATCSKDGKIIYTAKIILGGTEYSDIYEESVPATAEHNYVDGKCTVCGAIDTVKPGAQDNQSDKPDPQGKPENTAQDKSEKDKLPVKTDDTMNLNLWMMMALVSAAAAGAVALNKRKIQ